MSPEAAALSLVDVRARVLRGELVLRARRPTAEGCQLLLAPAARGLTAQQTRILARAASGASGKEVALSLGLRESTVSTHLTAAMDRLGLTRSEIGAIGVGGSGVAIEPGGEGERDLVVVQLRFAERLPEVLTSAEREVVLLALEGLSNRQIAAARRRSGRTVTNQLATSFRKLQVGSRGELFARCETCGGLAAPTR